MSPSKSGRSYTFDQFTAIRRYQLTLALSPDGSEAAYSTNISGQYNIWRQTTDGLAARIKARRILCHLLRVSHDGSSRARNDELGCDDSRHRCNHDGKTHAQA